VEGSQFRSHRDQTSTGEFDLTGPCGDSGLDAGRSGFSLDAVGFCTRKRPKNDLPYYWCPESRLCPNSPDSGHQQACGCFYLINLISYNFNEESQIYFTSFGLCNKYCIPTVPNESIHGRIFLSRTPEFTCWWLILQCGAAVALASILKHCGY
jgi:hypothetical protein